MAEKRARTHKSHRVKKTVRSSRRVHRPTKRVSRTAGVHFSHIDAALRRYQKALGVASSHAEYLTSLAHALGEAAVEKYRIRIIADWAEQQFLRDILALKDAFSSCEPTTLPTKLEMLRLFPDSIIQWMETCFGLKNVGEVGQKLEVPASRLSNYCYDFEPPANPSALVEIRIISPGWKRNTKILIPPRVELAQQNDS